MPERTRLTEMTIDLGDEQIVLERIDCSEALGAPFTILVDVLAPLEVDLRPHLGKPCALSVYEDDDLLRHFHGLMVAAEYQQQTDGSGHMHRYRLTLRPWSYFLDQNRSMAIYQDLSAVDIIKQVFADNGVSDTEFKIAKTYQTRVYCVQYQESDFAFVSRLMEDEGIYYYYRHEADKHVMVLCDSPAAHPDATPPRLTYNPNAVSVFAGDSGKRNSAGKVYLHSWHERVSTGAEAKVTLRDWDFKSPDQPLAAEASDEGQHPKDDREVYHYPGGYWLETDGRGGQEGSGRDKSAAMLEQRRAERRVFTGEAQASGLGCGTKVAVTGHAVDRMNADYLVTRTHHSLTAERYRSVSGTTHEDRYNVRFDAIPAETPFHSPQVTPRPIVHGLESAIVTGPETEEIYTDEYGRVKVRFHWDRSGSPGEKSTCWMRVSQTGGLGNIILPRVGHEVLVDFLGGDPDRPLVTGRVFNGENMPIYDLPANKTRALWRTKRYGDPGRYPDTKDLDTGAPGVNELRFEDKGGVEEVFLHAERDMKTRIRFDETHHVGHNQSLMIGFCRDEEVVRDESLKVGNDRKREVTHDETVKIGNDRKKDVGNDQKTTVGMNDTTEVGMTSKLTANQAVEIKVGQSSIKMDPMSITIKAPMIQIEGSIMTDVKGMLTTVKADTILTLKGALTLIN